LKITKDEVTHVAHLARLDFAEEEKEKFTSQLNDILMYVDTLNRIDTAGVEPMSHAIGLCNAFREDCIGESVGSESSLSNAPDARGPFFRVPKVIES
jgi:aspartyl-tRNA(Asn)/glutamyl-tRNA(Gln) amidotransferase subunit C